VTVLDSLLKRSHLAIRSLVRPRFKILAYHGVVVDHPTLFDVTFESFREQMQLLRDEGFRVLSLDDAVERNYNGTLEQNTVVITFDDGFRNLLDGAVPLLHDFGFSAQFFAVTGLTACGTENAGLFEGKEVMTWDELKGLNASGFSVGSHAVRHCDLRTLSEDELTSETDDSMSILTQTLGDGVYYFAYPYGLVNEKVRASVVRSGYRGALCFGSILSNWSRTDPFALKREKILLTTGLKEYRELVDTSYDVKRGTIGLCSRGLKLGRRRRVTPQ